MTLPSKDIKILIKIILYGMRGFMSMLRTVQTLLEKWQKGDLPREFD